MKTTALFLITILSSITVFAADAAAPAAQSAAWTFDDYLRGAFSGAVGGVISGVLALCIAKMNNNAMLKAQQIAYQNSIEKIAHEERKKICSEFIRTMSVTNILRGNYNIDEVKVCMDMLILYTNKEYYNCAHALYGVLMRIRNVSRSELVSSESKKIDVTEYRVAYEMLLKETRILFGIEKRKAAA